MAESAELSAVEISAPRTPKDKSCLLEVMGRYDPQLYLSLDRA